MNTPIEHSSENKRKAGEIFSENTDDFTLVEACKYGSREAFDVLTNKYWGRIYGFCFRKLGNKEDAADITQEVFFKFFLHAGKYQPGKAKFYTWLSRVAINSCIDFIRKKNRSPKAVSFDSEVWNGENMNRTSLQIPSQVPGPEQLLGGKQQAEQLSRVFVNLPRKQRAAVTAKYLQDFSVAEIAEMFSCPQGTIKTRLYLGRKSLSKLLLNSQKNGPVPRGLQPGNGRVEKNPRGPKSDARFSGSALGSARAVGW